MAYTLTPAERRARAQSLRESRENRKLYYNYLNQKAALEREQQNQKIDALQAEQEKANQSFLVRGLSTVGDIVANVLTGAVKGLEGIVDLGIGLVGGIGGIFDGDFQERAKNAIAYDWTGETFGNALQEALKYSYTTNGGIIENVASGIGQMLPSVVATIATAGAGAPAAVAQAASLGTLGVSAAGTSTEEAFREGADYWTGLGYGAASGLVEIGTEKMFGGATKALTGAGILDGITKSVADIGVPRIVKNALEEGVEEIVSELANPALKSIYKGSDALKEYGTGEYWKGVGEAGLVGSLTALAYSGTVGYGLSKVGVGYVGKEADIADSLSEIATLKEKANNLRTNGELTTINEQKIADTTKKKYQNIEKVLQGVSEDKRAQYIKKFSLENAFNPDGTMSGQMSAWFNSLGEQNANGENSSQNGLASLKKDSYSFNLIGQEQTIQSDLDSISENRANAYLEEQRSKGNEISIEQAREAVGEFKVFSGEMSDTAKVAKNKFYKALNYLNKESGANLSFVITEENKTFNGLIMGDKTLYIGEDQFENGTWADTLIHEYTHLSEDSEAYAKFVDFVSSDDFMVEDGNGGKVELWKKGQESVFRKGYVNSESIYEIHNKIANNQALTAEEQKQFKTFMSEVGAHEAEYLLGNEDFIDSIVAKESSFAQKFVQKIENLKKAFERIGDKESRQAHKRLLTAEKLWLKAAYKAGDMKLARFILAHDPELAKEIDVSAEIKYNKKDKFIGKNFPPYNESFSEANELATRWAKQDSIKEGWQKLISFQDNWYLVEKFSDMDNGYQIVEKIRKGEYDRYAKIIKSYEGVDYASSIDEGIRLYENGRAEQSIDSDKTSKGGANSDLSQMAQSGSAGEPSGVETRRNSEQGDRNQQVKYSLKDNIEEDVIKQYGKTYRWSETGYLLKDGSRVDMSGRNDGAPGGYRTIDHRDIFYDISGDYGTDAMVEFMSRGNIRVMPETPGINLQVEPTVEQYRLIQDMVERLGWKQEYFSVDFDNANGDTVDSLTYEGKVSARKVVADIQYYFKEGKIPYQSELSQFRYSLKEDSASAYEYEQTMKFSLVEDKKTLDFLNEQKHIKVYRAMQVIDGELYPPMAAKIKGDDGKTSLVEATQLGKWYQADEHPELVVNGKFTLNKGNGSSITAAYNPYWHTSKSPLNDQFTSAYKRNNLVTVECEVPESELTSGYKAQGAKDSVGEMSWHSGQVSSKLSGEKTRKVILSRWVKVNRIVSDSEVASKIAKLLEGENVSIPDNTVTPSLRSELEKLGVKITESGKVEDVRYSLKEDSDGRVLSESQKEYFKDSKVIDEDGNLMVVYHGTPKPNFSVFKLGDGALGNGIYFAESKEYSKGFSFGSNPYEVYLNITNPYEVNYPISDSITDKLIAKGYDGIHHKQNGFWVAFSPEQIKLVDNLNPTANEDIRFDLKESDPAKKYFYELSDGQIKKLIADKTMKKVYSKVESESVINTILQESLGIGEKYGSLVGKSKEKVVDMLWRGLNTAEPGKQMKVALDVAEYIIQNSMLETLTDEGENLVYTDTISALRPYLHSLDLSALKGEIKYKFDNDNSAYHLWGKRKGEKGLTADQVKMELEERGFYIDSDNEADIFFRMDSAYREAVDGLKKKTKDALSSALTKEERKTLKNNIAREVLLAFDTKGKQSKLSKILERYHKEALVWKQKYYDERTRNSVVNRLLDKVQKIKDIKLGTFLNASEFKSDMFKKSVEKLANIKFRGDLNQSGTRDIVQGLKEWYVEKNPLLEGVYDSDIAEMLNDIATGEGKLETQELRNLSNIVDYFKHFIENFNKVYRNGKYVEAQPIAEKYVTIMRRNQFVKNGMLKKFFEGYLTTFADPMTVARYMDKYESGFYSEMLSTLREGATNAQIDEMIIRQPIEDFIKRNKKYFVEAQKKTVNYNGQNISLLQAMYLYMAISDSDTIPSLAKSGFAYNDGERDIRVNGFAQNEDIEVGEMQARAKEIQSSLEKQFSAADKEYIEIARKIFNEECRKRYTETSIILKGYSNAKEGDYVPIRRANVAKNVDTSTLEYEINRASNASFTKDRVKGATSELRVEGIDSVVDRHIRAIAQYANLAPAIEEYNKLFNLNTVENNGKPVSVSTESRNVWARGDEYFRQLISDIQGVPTTKGVGNRFMRFVRGGYAKYQLAFNPKVLITQNSSFFAAGSILDYSSIVKGVGINTSDVDKYCQLAQLRNNDDIAAMAQGVLDKVDKFGSVLMKPIGMVDRFVVKKLFGACQVQVQKDNGLKIGTEENKVKAGELLKKVILETQQNSMATERSAAMRSGSEFMRTITMFSADSMKVIGRVVDSIGELSALKAKKKILTDTNEIANIDKQIKQATKKVAKSTASLVTSAVFMALVAQLFRTLYNKDDEDDNIVENMTVDAVGNLLGGLPIFKDVYSFFAEGYEVDGYAYSSINDLLNSGKNIFDMRGDLLSGEATSQDVAKNIKNMMYAAGQIFGIPVRNVYNMTYGLTKRISPSTAYKIDTAFYNKNYASDLKKAIARGDDDMIATIVELMTNERVGGIGDSKAASELNGLITKGFDVMPRSVGDKITYDGEEITLTSGQKAQFKKVYSVANTAVASLVKMSQYESATDEVKTKAIKYIYNVYYNLAIQDLLGVDLETKTVLFAEAIDIEKLAIIIATANALTADLDKKGNVISGTRKRKVQAYVNSLKLSAAQKYMIMGYLGYTNVNGEGQVKAYINRLKLTKSEKEKLLKYSGYEK